MFKKILEIIINFFPDWLKKIYEEGLLKIFIIIVFFVAFIPPFMVLIAACWLNLLSKSDNDALLGLRKLYLETVYNGFAIEDVASRSNVRLDYFQLFEFDLVPSNAPSKDFMVSIMPSQKSAIRLRKISMQAKGSGCSIPENEIEILQVYMDGILLKSFSNHSQDTIKINKQWWDKNSANIDDSNESEQKLSFKLSEDAKKITCSTVHVQGSLQVFKDLLKTSLNGTEK